MRNSFEVLFGPPPSPIVGPLRDQPDQLRDIAGRIKRWLLGQVHEAGRNPNPVLAREISEAFAELQDDERFSAHLEAYLNTPNQVSVLRSQLRDARQKSERLGLELDEKDRLNSQLRQEAMVAEELKKDQVTAWHWFVSGVLEDPRGRRGLPGTLFPQGAVPRAMLHHFRIIVERDDEYWAYEFDIAGRVRLLVTTKSRDLAREAYLLRSEKRRPGANFLKRPMMRTLIGATHETTGESLPKAIANGKIQPYVAVGMHPVFVIADEYSSLITHETHLRGNYESTIVEIVPLKEARRQLAGPGGRLRSKPAIKTRLAEHKRQKKGGAPKKKR